MAYSKASIRNFAFASYKHHHKEKNKRTRSILFSSTIYNKEVKKENIKVDYLFIAAVTWSFDC